MSLDQIYKDLFGESEEEKAPELNLKEAKPDKMKNQALMRIFRRPKRSENRRNARIMPSRKMENSMRRLPPISNSQQLLQDDLVLSDSDGEEVLAGVNNEVPEVPKEEGVLDISSGDTMWTEEWLQRIDMELQQALSKVKNLPEGYWRKQETDQHSNDEKTECYVPIAF